MSEGAIDTVGTLWVAPLDRAPEAARAIAERALPGLFTSGGRLAFAIRIDGPETAPFVADLTARQLALTALDDGPGPDEVLGFSPGGDEVLLLSGRTSTRPRSSNRRSITATSRGDRAESPIARTTPSSCSSRADRRRA